MSAQMLWMGAVASVAHFAAAVWWYRNGWGPPFRLFGTVVLAGTGFIAAYIVIRTLAEL